jgi:hypothetical protein
MSKSSRQPYPAGCRACYLKSSSRGHCSSCNVSSRYLDWHSLLGNIVNAWPIKAAHTGNWTYSQKNHHHL